MILPSSICHSFFLIKIFILFLEWIWNFFITILGSWLKRPALLISSRFIRLLSLFHFRLLFWLHLLFLLLILLCNLEIEWLQFFNWYHLCLSLCCYSFLFGFFGSLAYFSVEDLFVRISMIVYSIPLLLVSFWISTCQPLHIFIITCDCLYVVKYGGLCLYSE